MKILHDVVTFFFFIIIIVKNVKFCLIETSCAAELLDRNFKAKKWQNFPGQIDPNAGDLAKHACSTFLKS